MQSLKTATCVLFKADKSFHSFGYEAENEYARLVEDEKHKDWYFFRRFKMQLYQAKVFYEKLSTVYLNIFYINFTHTGFDIFLFT